MKIICCSGVILPLHLMYGQRYRQTLCLVTHTQGTHLTSGSPTQIHCKFKFYYKTRGMLEYSIIVTTEIQRNPEML